MKNSILTSKQFQREFLASFTIIQHLIYGLLIPILLLISLLAWDPKVFVFIFLAYSCGLIGFMFAKAMTNARTVTQNTANPHLLTNPKTETMQSPNPLHLGNLMTAHDLKEPLRQVYCYSQLLEQRYSTRLDDNGKEYLKFVLQGAKRMHQMMEDISALNRIEHNGTRFESINLSELLQHTLSTLHMKINETKAQITHDPLPSIKGDPGQMRHLFLNLIGNALKYRGNAAPRIHIAVEQLGDGYKFSFQDNGIGIASDQLSEVFGLFRRLHGQGKFEGTGVGLAICKQIVENHRGEIGVISSGKGQGTCFWFTVPD